MIAFKNGVPAGQIVMTAAFEATGIDPRSLLQRHLSQDWGDVPAEDRALNDANVRVRGGVMSSYMVDKTIVWIITDPGHEVTTILLPEDY